MPVISEAFSVELFTRELIPFNLIFLIFKIQIILLKIISQWLIKIIERCLVRFLFLMQKGLFIAGKQLYGLK